jgi:hypothetical protein
MMRVVGNRLANYYADNQKDPPANFAEIDPIAYQKLVENVEKVTAGRSNITEKIERLDRIQQRLKALEFDVPIAKLDLDEYFGTYTELIRAIIEVDPSRRKEFEPLIEILQMCPRILSRKKLRIRELKSLDRLLQKIDTRHADQLKALLIKIRRNSV